MSNTALSKKRVPPLHATFVKEIVKAGQNPEHVLWFANAIAHEPESEEEFWVVIKNIFMMGVHLVEYQYELMTGGNIYDDANAQDEQAAAAGAPETQQLELLA